jgi:DNA-cytosine methyltransferase
MRFVDLFAGLGGFHLGLRRLGHTCVFACEVDPDLRDLYRLNFGIEPAGDIRALDISRIPAHDLLCAGFPCQPFSKAGAQEGLSCTRWGDLFDFVLRVAAARKPSYLLLENVPNLRRHDGGATWRAMIDQLVSLRYSVDAKRLSPHRFGIPQIRDRVFIVASRAGLPGIVWPRPTAEAQISLHSVLDAQPDDARALSSTASECLEVWQAFLDAFPADESLPSFPIWSAEFGATYPFESTTPLTLGIDALRAHRGSFGIPLSDVDAAELERALPPYARSREHSFPHWKIRFIRQNRAFYERNHYWLDSWLAQITKFAPSYQKLEWNCKGAERNIWRHIVQFRASGVRVKRVESAPALVAMTTTQVPVIPWERRFMTVRECARLQSLDSIELPQSTEVAHKALGNAVNVALVQLIATGLAADSAPAASVGKPRRKQNSDRLPVREEGLVTRNGAKRINIRPGVSMLSVLRHLNYQPWYALAEFVDNAVQSFVSERHDIQRVDGKSAVLRVDIEFDPADAGRLTIRDNAAGIHQQDFARAFRAAEIPPDRSGLSEFGMGMKSAACWFAPHWTVRTKALGETVERTVTFDIQRIVKDSLDELEVRELRAKKDAHFTEISLSSLHRTPQTRTVAKIKAHLASIYRIYTRQKLLRLTFDGTPLTYETPAMLLAPWYKTPKAKPKLWKKDIEITLDRGRRVHGFAALRERGSTSEAGFALFRRRRLIQGSGDEGYRPEYIFGKSNTFAYQRLFGELHLEGFDVSHTKDGFQWEEDEEQFLEKLKNALDSGSMPLLQQAREYRSTPKREELRSAAEATIDATAEAIESRVPRVLDSARDRETVARTTPKGFFRHDGDIPTREFTLKMNDTNWHVLLELSDNPSLGAWVDVFDRPGSGAEEGDRHVGLRFALAHPFTLQFAGADEEKLEPLLRIAAAIGLAEIAARESGVRMAGAVRLNMNELLRTALAKP